MNFLLRRYLYSVTKRSIWFVAILIIPILCLTILAITPDRFLIRQAVMVSDETPVALGATPVGYGHISDIKSNPASFFENHFTLRAFYQKINYGAGDFRRDPMYKEIATISEHNMSLEVINRNALKITYFGPNKALGKAMVAFYSERLVHKSIEGLTRSKTPKNKAMVPTLSGKETIEYQRAIWRDTRVKPLAIITILSAFLTLFWMGVLEYMDHSLKSERQVARYTDLPILGSVPNIDHVYSTIVDHRLSDV